MAAVPLIDAERAPLLARPYYEHGDPGPIVSALAHVPELLEVCGPFLSVLFGPSAVPTRAKELVVLRTSARLACRFCTDVHSVAALDAGLSADEVRALRAETDGGLAGTFADPGERSLLAWTDALTRPGGVPPTLRAEFAAHFADHEVVELTLLAGATIMLNRFATALGLPVPPEIVHRVSAAHLAAPGDPIGSWLR